MKWTVSFFVFFCLFFLSGTIYAFNNDGDCFNCAGELVADTGIEEQQLQSLSQVNDALSEEVALTNNQQNGLCGTFLRNKFNDLKAKFVEYGTTLEASYSQVTCEGRADLLKHKMLHSQGRSDLAAFILYYKRELNKPGELVQIFNTVVPGPGVPSGTLLDFVQHYHDANASNSPQAVQEYARMITLLKAHGAKKASEL